MLGGSGDLGDDGFMDFADFSDFSDAEDDSVGNGGSPGARRVSFAPLAFSGAGSSGTVTYCNDTELNLVADVRGGEPLPPGVTIGGSGNPVLEEDHSGEMAISLQVSLARRARPPHTPRL